MRFPCSCADYRIMQTRSKTAAALLAKITKAGNAGASRASLLGKSKILEKQQALQELEKEGCIIPKSTGAIVFLFSAEHPPLPASEVLLGIVDQTSRDKGAVLWKEADFAKALTKLKHFSSTEATTVARAFCEGAQMLAVRDGKATKYVYRGILPRSEALDAVSEYFVSESARLIHALVELDGDSRQRALSVTQAHYRDTELAKQWRNRIAMQIHPDVCHHAKSHEAAHELTLMFQEMTS